MRIKQRINQLILFATFQTPQREQASRSCSHPAVTDTSGFAQGLTGIYQKAWLDFKWEAFKFGSSIAARIAGIQLFQCAQDQLRDLV